MIKVNMDMPGSCEDCPCCRADNFENVCEILGVDVTGEEKGEFTDGRLSNCPMQEVEA